MTMLYRSEPARVTIRHMYIGTGEFIVTSVSADNRGRMVTASIGGGPDLARWWPSTVFELAAMTQTARMLHEQLFPGKE